MTHAKFQNLVLRFIVLWIKEKMIGNWTKKHGGDLLIDVEREIVAYESMSGMHEFPPPWDREAKTKSEDLAIKVGTGYRY